MAIWTLFDMTRELQRQRGRLVELVEFIDEKNLEKMAANQRLRKWRRYYIPKNNGKGRPALKKSLPSREDEARRQQKMAEIAVIDKLLQLRPRSVEDALNWLQSVKDGADKGLAAQSDKSRRKDVLRKVDKLLSQFGARKALASPPVYDGPRPWCEMEVREVLQLDCKLQKARVRKAEGLPIKTLREQYRQDAERARLGVLERFLTSNHLAAAEAFLRHACRLQEEMEPPQNANDKTDYVKCSRDAIDDLVARLRLDFVMPV